VIKIRVGDIQLGPEEKKELQDVIDTSRLSEGPKTAIFEKLWAEFIGTKHCIAVNSGTSALIAGLYALLYDTRFPKFKKGAKVITTPLTYVATSNAIVLAGLEPVYVDVDPRTFALNIQQVEDLLKSSDPDEYCAILPVHLMGYMNDMPAICSIAKKYDLVVFEDAAQAHGSILEGKKAGTWGLLADYSFYIAHNVQAGEMGAVVTSDDRLRELVVQVKANGRFCKCRTCTRSKGYCPHHDDDFEPRFTHEFIGFNFKISEFQSAIAIPQVKRIGQIIADRQHNVKHLNELLDSFKTRLDLPMYSPDISYLAYPLIIKDPSINRHKLMLDLEKAGIETRTLFGCIPTQQPSYSGYKSRYNGRLPNAEYVGTHGIYIGCHQYLKQDDIEYIAATISKILITNSLRGA